MKLLVLGGTRFLGRHLVEAALARAMDVTIFTRGRSAVPWLDRVTSLVGDRDPRIAPGFDALAGRRFDAVVDCSGNSSRRATSRLGCSTCSSATSPARSTRRAPHGNGE